MPTKPSPKLARKPVSRGRGRPSAASQGREPLRPYTRPTPTIEATHMRRIGEAVWSRNWQIDFTQAVAYDKSLMTRVLLGSREMPAELPKRLKTALTAKRRDIKALLGNPLLAKRATVSSCRDMIPVLNEIGPVLYGTYWRADMAAALGVDKSLLTNFLGGKRLIETITPRAVREVVDAKNEQIKELLADPFLTPASVPA